jgi:MFS superfamily sulfate permease-like transporter
VAEVSGTLYYAAVPAFLERLRSDLPRSVERLIVDVSHAHQLRFAALEGFERLKSELERQGVEIVLAGVSPEFQKVLQKARSPLRYAGAEPTPGASARRLLEKPPKTGA